MHLRRKKGQSPYESEEAVRRKKHQDYVFKSASTMISRCHKWQQQMEGSKALADDERGSLSLWLILVVQAFDRGTSRTANRSSSVHSSRSEGLIRTPVTEGSQRKKGA